MSQNIELIIAADRHAGKIVEAARAERAQLLKSAREEQQAALDESSKKLSDLKQSLAYENSSYQKSCKARNDVEYADKKAILDEAYAKGKDKWLDDMYQRIITV